MESKIITQHPQSSEPESEKCSDCKFSFQGGEGMFCRFNPLTPATVFPEHPIRDDGQMLRVYGLLSPIYADWWCGQFQSRTKTRKKKLTEGDKK